MFTMDLLIYWISMYLLYYYINEYRGRFVGFSYFLQCVIGYHGNILYNVIDRWTVIIKCFSEFLMFDYRKVVYFSSLKQYILQFVNIIFGI